MGRAFRWASLTAEEQTPLGSEDILNYVRGDRSNDEPDGLSLRQRETILGDILHSTINYWDYGSSQSLYVGSNDGMLHAFDATTGIENFAYIPSMVIQNLDKLSHKPYVHSHYVDGPISMANIDDSGTQKTILVGGLGAGGAGLFALDVTSPTAASETGVANKVLWEITPTGAFSDLGHTYGTPILTRLGGTAVVIIGNGYMNTGNGHAVLYIINAITGALVNAIDTGSGSPAYPNGLSSPTLYNKDGIGDPEYVYAGDIDGNLWKFDLGSNTSSLVLTTSPAQAITSAPVVERHRLGGQMIDFATGRILTSGDEADMSVHYVYGVWDGAPLGNTQLVTQTLTASTFGSGNVRTVTNNSIDWSSGHDKGWKVALAPGERVVGEKPFYNNGRFYFLSTNPTVGNGVNWLHELVFNTGGAPMVPIFDLSKDGNFNNDDLAANGAIPIAKFVGSGVFSQPLLVSGIGLSTTLYAYHPNLPVTDGVPTVPDDPGVSGGHFDFDIYYYKEGALVDTPTNDNLTKTVCADKDKAKEQYFEVSPNICKGNFPTDYDFLSAYSVSKQKCGGGKRYIEATCSTYTSVGNFGNKKHVHEYDDKFDVTGVNMLNASVTQFNLANAIENSTTSFKILVMNQYLNPAAKLSVGGVSYESVKTYANLANETDAATLLSGLPVYTRATVGTLIYNLPLLAFKSQDWWGDGGAIRSGLIPTQTGCVNKVEADGSMTNSVSSNAGKSKGRIGPNGERFNGALTIQIIKSTTPSSAIELNGADVTYGWRVKQADFGTFVLAEYTTFWHHPNKFCYGDDGWVQDPSEDFDADSKGDTPAAGSADPTDGVFGAGLAIVNVENTVEGLVSTSTTTYSDNSQYIIIETTNGDGSTTIYQLFRDGTSETVTINADGGAAGFIDPGTGSPEEQLSVGSTGRQTWLEMY